MSTVKYNKNPYGELGSEYEKENRGEIEQSTSHTLKELLNTEIPPITYIVSNWIREGGLAIIYSPAKVGKTFLMMSMLLSIIKGKPTCGNLVTKQRNVLYLDFENGLNVVAHRLKMLLFGEHEGNQEFTEKLVMNSDVTFRLDDDGATKILETIIAQYNSEVVVIDPLIGAMAGDESKSTDVRKVFQNIRPLMRNGVSFIILHHTGKVSSRGMRGSSDFDGMVDTAIKLDKGKNTEFVEVICDRHRHREPPEPFIFKITNPLGESIRLHYLKKDPEQQTKTQECRDLLNEHLGKFERGERIKTAALKKVAKEQGDFKDKVSKDAINLLLSDKIIRKSDKLGWWIVE